MNLLDKIKKKKENIKQACGLRLQVYVEMKVMFTNRRNRQTHKRKLKSRWEKKNKF